MVKRKWWQRWQLHSENRIKQKKRMHINQTRNSPLVNADNFVNFWVNLKNTEIAGNSTNIIRKWNAECVCAVRKVIKICWWSYGTSRDGISFQFLPCSRNSVGYFTKFVNFRQFCKISVIDWFNTEKKY